MKCHTKHVIYISHFIDSLLDANVNIFKFLVSECNMLVIEKICLVLINCFYIIARDVKLVLYIFMINKFHCISSIFKFIA